MISSTIYRLIPSTEEIRVPLLEKESGHILNKDFLYLILPKKNRPVDYKHCIADDQKATSDSTTAIAKFVDNLYSSNVNAGIHVVGTNRFAVAENIIEKFHGI